jgi:type IV secretion system protein VirB5
MRIKLFGYALVFGILAFAGTARAQIPVIDASNLAQNVVTAAQEVQAVVQLKNQLTELQNTYSMFTSPTDIMSMATGMEIQAIENPMPLANNVASLMSGASGGTGSASTFYMQNHVYSPTDGTAESAQLNNNAQSIANIEGMAQTNLMSIQARLQNLPDLESDIQSATSITQVSAINGRIAVESQFVQAQQAQAANLQVLASEQSQANQQQIAEKTDEDMTNYSSELQNAAAGGVP